MSKSGKNVPSGTKTDMANIIYLFLRNAVLARFLSALANLGCSIDNLIVLDIIAVIKSVFCLFHSNVCGVELVQDIMDVLELILTETGITNGEVIIDTSFSLIEI